MIGNDVIDLRDPETRAVHPRFDERVMAPSEHGWLAGRADPARDRWLLWAAKEAAYKAARRIAPTVRFSPNRFVADLGLGRVSHGDLLFDVEVSESDDAIHAVATLRGTRRAGVVAAFVRGAPSDPSAAARRLAVDVVSARAGLRDPGVVMSGRLPELRSAESAPLALSLSHHGEVVGFAADLGGGAA